MTDNLPAPTRRNMLVGVLATAAAAGVTSEQAIAHVSRIADDVPRKILHVRVGGDEWEPTHEELHEVMQLFRDAVIRTDVSEPAVIVTRHDVVVEVIDVTGRVA